MIQIIRILLLTLLLQSCVSESTVDGLYILNVSEKNIDSLWIQKNHIYKRKIVDKKNRKIILSDSQSWEYRNSKIVLKNFLRNTGKFEYDKEIQSYDKYRFSSYEMPVEWTLMGVGLILNSDLNYYYVRQ